MNNILRIFFSMSLSGSLLISVLFLCKPMLKNKTSRQWQYYAWLIAVARLLLPFTPETSLMGTLFGQSGQTETQRSALPAPEDNMFPRYIDDGLTVENNMPQAEHYLPQAENSPQFTGNCPSQPESSPRLPENYLSQTESSSQFPEYCLPQTGNGTLPEDYFPQAENADTLSQNAGTKPSITAKILQYLWLVWLGIASLLLIRKITVYQSFVAYIRAGREEVSDIVLLDQLAQIGAQVNVKQPVELYANSLVSSPLLLGFFRPCIVLPTTDLPPADFQYTVRHELTHYKRLDMFYKWLMQITICLHWFNPLIWLMSREICQACELACDEAVIRNLDASERQAYGNTLLHAAETGNGYKNSLASVTLGEDAKLLKERLKAIMEFKKNSKALTALSLAFAAILMSGAAALGTAAAPKASAPSGAANTPETAALSKLSAKSTGSAVSRQNYTDGNMPMPILPDTDADDGDISMKTLDFKGTTYYLVFNEAQLRAIGTGEYSLDSNYMQQADIQLSADEWIPIGTKEHPFSGSYNGNGFEITGLTMVNPDAEIIGLFGVAQNARLYNITMRDYDIMDAGKNISGRSVAPILALGLGNVRSYDNFAYPKEPETDAPNHNISTPAALAEKSYEYGSLPQFSLSFAVLDEDSQETWLERIYNDEEIAFFSVSLQQLDTGSPFIAFYANRAYEDGNISFFSVLTDYMDKDALEAWLDKALQEKRINFQSVLFTALDEETELNKMKTELDRQALTEYESYGITMDGKSYYYQGHLVNIFLDIKQDSSFYTLDMNPQGTVNIKVTRSTDGKIKSVDYMDETEINKLFGDMDEPDDE